MNVDVRRRGVRRAINLDNLDNRARTAHTDCFLCFNTDGPSQLFCLAWLGIKSMSSSFGWIRKKREAMGGCVAAAASASRVLCVVCSV